MLPVTLGRHHKPFGSARTARALRAFDLAGALHALWRTERRGAREKGVDQDGRTIRDWPDQRVQRRRGGLEWIQRFLKGSRAARDGTCPTCIESSSRRSGGGSKNAEIAFLGGWYKLEIEIQFGEFILMDDNGYISRSLLRESSFTVNMAQA